jgi:hypothetical protein
LHVFTGDKLRKETWPFHQQWQLPTELHKWISWDCYRGHGGNRPRSASTVNCRSPARVRCPRRVPTRWTNCGGRCTTIGRRANRLEWKNFFSGRIYIVNKIRY